MKNLLQTTVLSTLLVISHGASAQVASNTTSMATPDDEIVVIGTDQRRYRIQDADALTGFQLDFLELPRVVNIIPEQLILDQKITDLNEALRNTPGVTQSDGFGGTNDDFLIRGFRRNTVYRNGFRRATNFKTNLTNVEYTQIVRGPASITYGQVEPGGLVDIVTKTPLEERRIAGEARFGSFEDQFYLVDWSEPVTDNFAVRIVASTQQAEGFRDFTNIERDTASISARYDVTPSTRIDLSYEYRDEARPLDRGTVTVATPDGRAIVNNLIDIPIERRFGEAFEISETEFQFFDATLEQDFGDNWKLCFSAAYEDSTTDDLQARPRSVFIFDANAPITQDGFFTGTATRQDVFDDPSDLIFLSRRTDGSRQRETEAFYANAILTGEFETGAFNHRIALGGDYRAFEQTRFFVTTPTTDGVAVADGGDGPLLNLRNPVYGQLPDTLSTDGRTRSLAEEDSFGFFFNDYVELTDKLSVLLGVRYDSFEAGDANATLDSESAFSPQAAINYEVAENASVFFSYSEAFEPNFVVNPESGGVTPFDPEESEQFELGAKAEFFDGRVQATAALYSIEKSNVLILVDGVVALRDGQTSDGVELSISGQPVPGMNIVAGYAYTDSELSSGANAGNTARNVAENTFNLWASYEVQAGALEGLGVGGGVFFQGDRFGDDANTYTLDSYTVADLSTWYTVPAPGLGPDQTVRLQFTAKNIFDEEYFPASGGNERINIGAPRSYFGSISFDF
ncbi:MAG: TonB-dependent siderophore receptor [Pseudomonadota bacterium]